MKSEERIVAAARAMIGVPFRLHGRSRETGVDCVGLALLVLAEAGDERAMRTAPGRYSIRGGHLAFLEKGLRAAGLGPADNEKPGDFVLVRAGIAQFHLMIAVEGGHVHAHAGLGRVVEMPGESPWPVIGRWRLNRNS